MDDDRTPALWELSTMDNDRMREAACPRCGHLTDAPGPCTDCMAPPRKTGLDRAAELAAQFKIAQWADAQMARNRARERYQSSDGNYGGDWPEDH